MLNFLGFASRAQVTGKRPPEASGCPWNSIMYPLGRKRSSNYLSQGCQTSSVLGDLILKRVLGIQQGEESV